MQYYVYTLSISDCVVYVGYTKCLPARYRQHYNVGAAMNYLRYIIQQHLEAATVNVVYFTNDKRKAVDMETKLIADSFKSGRKLFNWRKNKAISRAYKFYPDNRPMMSDDIQKLLMEGEQKVLKLVTDINNGNYVPLYN